MTETKVTEFVVGCMSAYMFLLLFPIAHNIQNTTMAMYSVNVDNAPLIISAATLLFCIVLYGIIAIYCLGACLEKLYFIFKT